MSAYLPPLNTSSLFNVSDYNYQDNSVTYKELIQATSSINTTSKTSDMLPYNSTTDTTEFQHNVKVDGNLNVSGTITGNLSGSIILIC